jgi:hypothetical protein
LRGQRPFDERHGELVGERRRVVVGLHVGERRRGVEQQQRRGIGRRHERVEQQRGGRIRRRIGIERVEQQRERVEQRREHQREHGQRQRRRPR